jgi:hypothetical protein
MHVLTVKMIWFTLHRLVIKKPADSKKFVVYLTAKACFEEKCVPDVKIFDGTQIPQPVCDLYADFSMKGKRYLYNLRNKIGNIDGNAVTCFKFISLKIQTA